MKNAGEMLDRIKGDRRLAALIALLACGAALVALSFLLAPQEQETPTQRGAGVEYAMADVEERLSAVLSQIDGAGQVMVLVTENDGEVRGVLVVAQGADELTVRTELMRAAMTALDVPASSVEVFAGMKQQGE